MTSQSQNEAIDSESEPNEVERGPNGFPYVDIGRTSVSRWENGEYHLKIAREGGELLCVNLTEGQFKAMEKTLDHVSPEEDDS